MDSHQRIAESFALQGLTSTLGASLAFVNGGEVHIAMPASAHISQQHVYTHAGAITSILDSACGYAALTKAAESHEVVTAEFKINLMRPALGVQGIRWASSASPSGSTRSTAQGPSSRSPASTGVM